MQTIRLFQPYVAEVEALTMIGRVLRSGYLGEGPECAAFERELQAALQYPYVLLTNSGTSALELAYDLLELDDAAIVATTPLTCTATNLPLYRRGCYLRWIDVDPTTGGMDPERLREAFAARDYVPTAVVVCDWGGDPGALLEIRRICDTQGVPLIEDAAHAFLATVDDGRRFVGSIADCTAFSFQAIKALTTGDGGALCTLHAHHYGEARLRRWFGLDRIKGESMRCYQQIPIAGGKYQSNDLAAALGRANLPQVGTHVAQQQRTAALYDEAFAHTEAITPLRRQPGASCWLYTLRVRDAQRFIRAMEVRHVEASQVHARNDTQVLFRDFRRALPGMDQLAAEMVCIPNGWWLTEEECMQVIRATLDCAHEAAA